MKKFYLLLTVLTMTLTTVMSQTITTGAISTPICAGATISIPYTIVGTFTSGNFFVAQLSNSTGAFTTPVLLDSVFTTAAGTITTQIPYGTAAGTGYLIRVIGRTPAITGTANATALTINANPFLSESSNPFKLGNALNFDGSNDKVTITDNTVGNFGTDAFTVEFWMNTTKGNSNLISKRSVCGAVSLWNIKLNGNNVFAEFLTDNTGAGYLGVSSSVSVTDGQWHHVAVTRNTAGLVTIFIDGVNTGSGTNGLATPTNVGTATTNTANVTIAASACGLTNSPSVANFKGSMDEVRLWGTERTLTQINASRFLGALGTDTVGLKVYYDFNLGTAEGTNTTETNVTDKSRNVKNATLSGFALTGKTSNWVISGISALTVGSTAAYTNSTSGGQWSITNLTGSATITSAGVVTGVSMGTVSVNYTLTTGSCTVVSSGLLSILPAAPTASNVARCGTGTAVINATVAANCTVDWYAAATGGTVLAGGTGVTSFTTPSITTTTIYYAETRNTVLGYLSATRTPVTVTVEVPAVVAESSNPFKLGNALNFDGNDDKVTVTDNTVGNFGTGAFTVEFWMNTTQGNSSVISKRATCNGAPNFWNIKLTGSNIEVELNGTGGAGNMFVSSNQSVTDGQWHHVAVTRSTAGLVTIYVDGVSRGTGSLATPTDVGTGTNNTANVAMGISACVLAQGVNNFKGSMDEVRLWSTERTLTQINASKFLGALGTDNAGLVAYYDFNLGTAEGTNTTVTTVTDKSVNVKNATLTGFALTGKTSNWINSGIGNICIGSTAAYSNTTTGGVWSVTNGTGTATITTDGVVTGVTAGTVTVNYTLTTGTCSVVSKSILNMSSNTAPAAPTAGVTQNTVCSGSSTLIDATFATGTNIKMYVWTTATPGTGVDLCNTSINGFSCGTGVINATTTFYLGTSNVVTGCQSATRFPVVATIYSAPAAPVTNGASVCNIGETAILTATVPTGYTVDWYAAATGGTILAGGTGTTSFTTPSITANTTYYAQARPNATCSTLVSATRTPATVTINAAPAVTISSSAPISPIQVTTLAGASDNTSGFADGTGSGAIFNFPTGVAVDASGNVYVADNNNNIIRKITPAGVVRTLAGSGYIGSIDATASAASFFYPRSVAVDASGNVYVADVNNHKIRKITPNGVVSTLAGSGSAGSNDGTGSGASFHNPYGVAVDASGNVYVADASNNKIRKITPAGVVSTLAGSGADGSADGAGSSASFGLPYGVAADGSGNVYVADRNNHKIRKITPTGVVSTLAGSGASGSADGTGSAASFNFPTGVAVDASGYIYVADQSNNKIRKITPAGVVSTLAGSGADGSADGAGSSASFGLPTGVAADASGNIYVADAFNNKIRKIIPQVSVCSGSALTLTAGGGATYSWSGPQTITNGASFNATTSGLYTVTFTNTAGCTATQNINVNVLSVPDVTFSSTSTIINQEVTLCSGSALTLTAGGGATYSWSGPQAITNDVSFNATTSGLYTVTVTNADGCTATQSVNVIANSLPSAPTVATPSAICSSSNVIINATTDADAIVDWYDAATGGNLLASSTLNYTTLQLTAATTYYAQSTNTTTGCVSASKTPVTVSLLEVINANINSSSPISNVVLTTTLAGSGIAGSADGTGSSASFSNPYGVAVDATGNVYVADANNRKIRKITSSGVVSTLAGSGAQGSADGTGSSASFNKLNGVAVDASGNVYVSDNFRIRKITPAGLVSTLVISADLTTSEDLAVDATGNVYVSDYLRSKIRQITPAGGLSLLAGSGVRGSADGTGSGASFNNPVGVAVDGSGNVYVADQNNNKIRKITPAGVVSTFAGSGVAGNVDGTGSAASFANPQGIAVDASGNVYVIDGYNQRIRKITPEGVVSTIFIAVGINLWRVAVDASGNVYVADKSNNKIRKIYKESISVCSGSPLKLTASGGVSYSWSGPQAITNGATFFTNTSGLYTVTVSNNVGCTTTKSIYVNTNPTPSAPIVTTPAAICSGSSAVLNATVDAGNTVDWYSASANNPYPVDLDTLSYTTPALTTSAIYYAQSRNITTGCGSSTWTPVTVTITATITPATPASITQTQVSNTCGNRVYRYTAAIATNANGYVWTVPATVGGASGFVVDSGDVNNSRIIKVRFSSNVAAITTDSIFVKAKNCGSSSVNKSAKLTIVALTLATPTITITTLSTACGAKQYRYAAPALPVASTTAIAGTGYVWSFSGTLGANAFIDSGNVNSQVIRVTYTSNVAAVTGDSVKVYYTSACGNSNSVSSKLTNTFLGAIAAPVVTVTPVATSICGARRYRYSASALPAATATTAAATGWLWSNPEGTVGSTGTRDSGNATSKTITVTYTSNAAAIAGDTIRVAFTSACGSGTSKATKLTNTLLAAPAAPTVTVAAVATNVCGARVYRYTASALPIATATAGAATGWSWSLPTGPTGATGTLDSGVLGGQVIKIRYTSNAAAVTGDSIRVRFTSGCGLGTVKATKLTNTVLTAPLAPATVTIALVSNVCGVRVYRYTAPVLTIATTTAGAATGYAWSLPSGPVGATGVLDSGVLVGAGARFIKIRYSSNLAASAGDSIKVAYQSVCGNGATKAQFLSNLLLTCVAPTPVITKVVTNASIPMSVIVYPNPTAKSFNLMVKTASFNQSAKAKVYDLQGRVIKTLVVSTNTAVNFGNDLKAGVYFVEVKEGENTKTVRVVKY